ncbi:MAG: glycosyltransferase family 2 protein [Patescibacteria group bacterium]
MSVRVAILYLCHQDRRYLPDVVEAIKNQTYAKENLAFVFLPNGAQDGIQDDIRAMVLPRSKQDLPEVILLDDGVNHGFAGGNNLGIKWAIEHGFDYVFLHNGDLALHPRGIEELVNAAEADTSIGSEQPLVSYWGDHEKVNTAGGIVHLAGYGYAVGNGKFRSALPLTNGQEISYASGAAVLYRVDALKKVGLLEEAFFMYHEDLELGLRLRLAGFKNVLVTTSEAYHDYHFSRNPKKFQWTELYRLMVLFSIFKIETLLLLAPLLICVEIGTWILSLKGGWAEAKIWCYRELLRGENWETIRRMRARNQSLRTITDQIILGAFTGSIDDQEVTNWVVERFANPCIELYKKVLLAVVRW